MAVSSYFDPDTLNLDEFLRWHFLIFNFQAQLDGLSYPFHESIQRLGLRVAPAQFWNTGYIVPFSVSFNNDIEHSCHFS